MHPVQDALKALHSGAVCLQLEHLVFVKTKLADGDTPEMLDFENVYCFSCGRQELYRAQPVRASVIDDPVLRFQCVSFHSCLLESAFCCPVFLPWQRL